MDDTGLSILSGVAQGIEKAAQNIYNINIAKGELERKKQEHAIDMKIKEAQLKKYELDPDMDPEQASMERELNKKRGIINSNIMDIQAATIDAALKDNNDALATHKQRYQGILDAFGGLAQIDSGSPGQIPMGKDFNLNLSGAVKPTKPGETELYRARLNAAKAGKISWDEVKGMYPEPSKQDDIEEVRRSALPKLERSPKFRVGKGLPALISKDVANLNEKTAKYLMGGQIENQEDLDELLSRRDEAEAAGIDVDAILEYFGKR